MTYLDGLLEERRKSVARTKAKRSLTEVRAAAREIGPRRDFAGALLTGMRPSIIAEFKRAS
ncbi:MAG TPA: hypothetical protein VEV38_10765, partial [Candidatus Eremiobacteraceae bacterium]|nr:hypothetical protein [Candidatus Eremiobacteraceae bacterium]